MPKPLRSRQNRQRDGPPAAMLNPEDEARAEHRLERLIVRLPRRMAGFIHWLREPSRFWLRVPLGILLFCGGFLGMLPILGFWMIPLGVVLIAQDIRPLRRGVYRLIN